MSAAMKKVQAITSASSKRVFALAHLTHRVNLTLFRNVHAYRTEPGPSSY
jgi:hypothetical protein